MKVYKIYSYLNIRRPEVLENGDIRLEYSHGDLYKNDRGDSCNMSAEIILRCDDKEYGPR